MFKDCHTIFSRMFAQFRHVVTARVYTVEKPNSKQGCSWLTARLTCVVKPDEQDETHHMEYFFSISTFLCFKHCSSHISLQQNSCRLFLTIFVTLAWCLQSSVPSGWCWGCCLSNLLPTSFLHSCLIYSHHIMIAISRLPAMWKCHQPHRTRPLCHNAQPLKVC